MVNVGCMNNFLRGILLFTLVAKRYNCMLHHLCGTDSSY